MKSYISNKVDFKMKIDSEFLNKKYLPMSSDSDFDFFAGGSS